ETAAPIGPTTSVHVRIARLVLRVDAALALALDTQQKRNPAQAHGVALRQREGWVLGEVGERALVVEVQLEFFGIRHRPCPPYVRKPSCRRWAARAARLSGIVQIAAARAASSAVSASTRAAASAISAALVCAYA